MRVLAVVPSIYDTSPGQRFRIEQWEPILAAGGVELTYAPFETDELKAVLHTDGNVLAKVGAVTKNMRFRSRELDNIANYDLVYLFREAAILGPPWFERKIAKAGVPIVFDLDDAIFVSYKSPSNGYLSYLKFPTKTAEICSLSAHIMPGNEYLRDYCSKYNQNLTIIPTTIDTDKYTVVERPEPETVTIGWSGSFSTVQHLDTIRDVLQKLAKTENFRLRVIGTPNYKIPDVDTEAMQWRSETELHDLRQIDIGLMPLPDENWTKGKCGLKALQYMALGIPTICSPVGVNSTIIKDGENGYLADGTDDWVEKLKLMLHSPELRRRIGMAGRKTVEEEYSAKVIAPKVLEIFRSVARAAKSA
ncbi:MAG: glycosyltransferase family 4 protein [Acidobacteria bacterium]|nr:glycosyltransferase family 4 protein [Acidobacteriota bacterium]